MEVFSADYTTQNMHRLSVLLNYKSMINLLYTWTCFASNNNHYNMVQHRKELYKLGDYKEQGHNRNLGGTMSYLVDQYYGWPIHVHYVAGRPLTLRLLGRGHSFFYLWWCTISSLSACLMVGEDCPCMAATLSFCSSWAQWDVGRQKCLWSVVQPTLARLVLKSSICLNRISMQRQT